MKLKIILLGLVFFCACVGKPQYIPPVVETEQDVEMVTEPVQEEAVVEVVEPPEENTFISIVLKEGIPAENIIPRSKEQVAVYKYDAHYTFYYFKKNKLVLKKDYTLAELDRLKSDNLYPEKVLVDLGAK